MKNTGRIYKTDMKNAATNWVATMLIVGLIFLPSLYAWLNIKATWDPYGQTDQIPVGIVNEDVGVKVRDKDVHVGDDLVKTLKENKSMDWKFVDRDKAMKKVNRGDYFAVIVIPKDFSKKLGTVIDNKPQKATVEYYVNEKINAIAPKITSKSATVIVNEVSSKFVGSVNGVIFETFNDLGLELESDLPDIQRFEEYIFKVEKDLPEIHKTLNDSYANAASAKQKIQEGQAMIPKAEKSANDGLEIINNTTGYLNEAEGRLNAISPKIKTDLNKVRDISSQGNAVIKKLQNPQISFEKGGELVDQFGGQVVEAQKKIETIEQTIKALQAQATKIAANMAEAPVPQPDESAGEVEPEAPTLPNRGEEVAKELLKQQQADLQNALDRLAVLKGALQEVQGNMGQFKTFTKDKKQEVDQKLAELDQLTANTTVQIDGFIKEYNERIEPTVLAQISQAKVTLNNAHDMLTGIQKAIPGVATILNDTNNSVTKGQDMLQYGLAEFPYVNSKINELAERIRSIQGETDIGEIITLLQNDSKAESSFFEEPVKLSEHKLYPIPNYGSGMAPFYTTLAIWVGCLLLISLMSVEVKREEGFTDREEYFGRFLTFITIGFLQTLIVTLGDIHLLGVYVKEPFWFVIFGLVISLVFMLIVYTLVSVFGDVGKAMAIVMLVLQIAASGGTYPVALLPKAFQVIHPFLPFSYGVNIMREAVGGIVWEKASHDLIMLSFFGIGAIILGAFLKKPVNKQTRKLMKKSKESGLFH